MIKIREAMDEDKAVEFLRCPATALVDLAMKMANLTWREELAVTRCGRNAETQDVAAQKTGYSVDAIQKWYRSGIKKICQSWYGVWWITKIVD